MAHENVIMQVAPPGVEERAELSAVAELPEVITLNLRGTKFEVRRERLLALPESVLFSLSTGMNSQTVYDDHEEDSEPDTMYVDFDPDCFSYILNCITETSHNVVPIPISDFTANRLSPSENHMNSSEDTEEDVESETSIQWLPQAHSEIPYVLKSRPTLIVLREDLEYYVVRDPRSPSEDDFLIKDLVGDSLQNGQDENFVFNGLKTAHVLDSPEYHLMQMLVLSGIDPHNQWHYRRRSEYTSRVLSLQISRIKLPESPDMLEAIYALQKLLLFWRKPAKKCWWDRFDMAVGPTKHSIDGKPERVRVHVRRVWTLELTIMGLEE